MTAAVRTARPRTLRTARPQRAVPPRPLGLAWAIGAEGFAAAVGFAALAYQARRLGPASFARVEYAAAVAAWLLVLVRGGFDVIVYREAARRPRLVRRLTDRLVGLRLMAAGVGYGLALVVAALVGPDRGVAVALAGLGLFASAWVTDVGPRAEGRLGWVAVAQAVRALGWLAAVLATVRGPADVARAAAALGLAEIGASALMLAVHGRRYGWPRPRFFGRATRVLAARGAVAGLSRFARVTLYGADLLALGWWAGGELGPYAAARRVVYALAALGLVVPAALGPTIAAAFAAGVVPARRRVGAALGGLWSLSLPAAVGLALTADRWMPALFGDAYRDGAPWLSLVAARLPWLLAAGFAQAALVACRREGLGLRLVAGQLAIAAVAVPVAVAVAGPWGVGWAAVGIEAAGALAGWVMMARLGVAPGWAELTARPLVGCLGLFTACRLTHGAPLAAVVVLGAVSYAAAWRLADRCAGTLGGMS